MESQRSADDDVGPYIFPDLSTCNFDECRGALDAIGACKLRWRPSYSIHYSKVRSIFCGRRMQLTKSRTGRYKLLSILGAILASLSYTLILARWHRHTSFLESLYTVPGGFSKWNHSRYDIHCTYRRRRSASDGHCKFRLVSQFHHRHGWRSQHRRRRPTRDFAKTAANFARRNGRNGSRIEIFLND